MKSFKKNHSKKDIKVSVNQSEKIKTLALVLLLHNEERTRFFLNLLEKIKPEFLDRLELYFCGIFNDEIQAEITDNIVIKRITEREKFIICNCPCTFHCIKNFNIQSDSTLIIDETCNLLDINELLIQSFDIKVVNAFNFFSFSKDLKEKEPILLTSTNIFNAIIQLPEEKSDKIFENLSFYAKNTDILINTIQLSEDKNNRGFNKKTHYCKSVLSDLKKKIRLNFILPLFAMAKKLKGNQILWKEPLTLRFVWSFLLLFMLISMPLLSRYAGVSGDEEKHQNQAAKVYNYIATSGKDSSALVDPKLKLNFYGQSFDFIAYVFNKSLNVENIYESRHVLNSLVGFLAILFTGLLALEFAGYTVAIIAIILMYITPCFLGHSLNNPMDVPFLFGYIFSIYYLFKFLRKLPVFSVKYASLLALGIGLTISVRIGGLILIPYLGLFAFLYFLFTKWDFKIFSKDGFKLIKKGIIYIAIISIAAYFISIFCWPYAWQSPLTNPFIALKTMSNIDVALRVLFEGKLIWSNILPWYYITKFIFITVPAIVLIGFFLSLLFWFTNKKDTRLIWKFFLLFAVVFPIWYILFKNSNVYGGWRHLLFIYPAMVILASIGLKTLIDFFKSKYIKILIIIIYVGALYHPVRHIIVNTDNIYIYFNEFIGGIDNTKGKYENDYYFNSLKSGSKWLLENELKNLPLENGKKIRVASNGSISYYFRNDTARVKPFYLKYYERNNYDWDYAIIFCNYLSPYQLSHGLWPPKNTIHTIYVDNTPVCAILKRTDKNDYYGYKAEQQDSLELAYNYYLKALQIDPNNESVIINLGSLYNRTHNFNETVSLMNNCLTNVYPDFDNALDILSVAYLNLGDYESAQRVLNRLINVNYKYVNAYYNMALLYLQQNLNDLALQYLDQALKINGNFKPAYLLIAEILNSQGRKEDANSYIQAAKQLK